ncbi:MAG TPA: transglycosylase SLT domain-containing protein [Burkholderiaceae bacterium]|nr:transglycosylase SLT domain-containing protein [Burkholderiaceae bacterium]
MFDPSNPNTVIFRMEEIDVWQRIRDGFAIPDLVNPLVTAQTEWYSSRPDYIQRTTTRASLYLFHVVQELEKRHMPTELALLPFIESAFNPQAYSTAKAAGMWQFIPSTGLDFNLKQNMFRDERRDVLASTDAALTYLQKLYGMFGDWQLALAAYNWGEGSVQRAINKNRAAGLPTDFNSLSPLMPAETRNYVPKLQAVKNIIAAPAMYNIALPKVDNQPYFVTIDKTHDIDLKVAAQLAELSLDEFKALNPQFNRPVITGGADTQILLPEGNAKKFKANLGKWTQALSSWTAHTVHSARERIETIAAKFNTTPEVLREANRIPPKMRLKAGSTILVPRTAETANKDISIEVLETAKLAIEPDVPDSRRIHVKVGKKDTLASIANRYKVSVADLKAWNSLHSDHVASGKSLALQVSNRSAASAAGHRKTASASPAKKSVTVARAKQSGKTVTAARSSRTIKKAPARITLASER